MADSFDFTVNLFLENFHTAFEPKAGFKILPALLIASFAMAVCRKPGTVIFVDFRFNFIIVPEKNRHQCLSAEKNIIAFFFIRYAPCKFLLRSMQKKTLRVTL